ncbi:MAG: hypothetical protein ACTSVR_06870, partial [Candidatus Thorarchaeota archaeon]
EKGEEMYSDSAHRRALNSDQRLYLGTVKRGERTVHYCWIYADEEMMTIDEGSGGVVISGNLKNPLKRIPQKEMTIAELEQAGEFEIPPAMMREVSYLYEIGASVIGPLEYRAYDVLLPLLGIRIIPEDDTEKVKAEEVDLGIVRFSG